MRKSSAFTFLYKYIFPIGNIVFLIFMFSFFFDNQQSNFLDRYFLIFFLAGSTTFIFLIKLQAVEASDEHLLIKIPFKPNIIVQYEDIEWVYQVAMLSPSTVSLKYKDIITKESRTILIMDGEIKGFGFAVDSEMIKFLRNKITEANPNYNKKNEPNKWKPMLIIYASFFLLQIIIFSSF
jgi:hypothetical protein